MDDRIERFRADIGRGRAPGAYVPGRWSVAPANRDAAVTGVLPEHVRLRDTSMRAIESMPGVAAAREAKAGFLRSLARSGVPEIVTAGPGGRDPDAVRAELALIRAERPDCVVSCPFVSTAEAADLARDLGYDAVQVAVPGFGPASGMFGGPVPASRDEVVVRAAAVVGHARARGLRVAAALTLVSYLTDEDLAGTAAAVARAGADEIVLFDGPGAVGPEAFARLVEATVSAAPGVEVGIHPHNTFGLGVACAVAAVRAGAVVVESSVNGYCGGPGNADLAATAAAFEALYGVRTGLRLDALTGLAREGAELTGHPAAANQPITGRDAFSWGGGDWVVAERDVDPLIHNCVEPALFGNERRIPLTAQSGPLVMADILRRLGVSVDPSSIPAVVDVCHAELSRLGRPLTDEEIRALARSVLAG
ncbi:hypothetical protein [Actinomadura decatromicini]|uniref:Pyruvate carboxyltransferase domain-containing protein n=1 Tax=Actinomadura decatromicini TaxID=2604572 RepID=A0A5D3FY42_9ACTN|nr:hypothetical protein [Actinomadura decatromicini]TYK52640.1 hypothetical protein FXF68_02395 [Actinomadura decatromicini]